LLDGFDVLLFKLPLKTLSFGKFRSKSMYIFLKDGKFFLPKTILELAIGIKLSPNAKKILFNDSELFVF
jgi:hypothetical protein